MSIYSNDNISKIAKLTTRELPHLAKTAKITVRENNGVYSNKISLYMYYQWQSVRGDPEHFDILVISWQYEHFWANNWQGKQFTQNYKIMI